MYTRAMTRREMLVAAMGCALVPGSGMAAQRRPDLWIMPPPWPGDGRCLWEMVTRESEWREARKLIAGIGYWPWLLNQHFTDERLRTIFQRIRAWGTGFGLEGPVYKGPNWGYDSQPLDARSAFEQNLTFIRRFERAGMPPVRWFAFDEPVYAARHVAPRHADAAERLRHGAQETARFVTLMRGAFPKARLGDVEPYPALTVEEITGAVTAVQSICRNERVRGLDFVRLDVDWWLFASGNGSWEGVRRIEDFCRRNRLAFSLIYWASNEPRLPSPERSNPLVWRDAVVRQAEEYARAGGRPDQTVLESWLHVPQHAVPETDPTTFTASLIALHQALGRFAPARPTMRRSP